MNDRIDAVLVDTSVYHKKQCDFEGITNSIIPMLLQLLRANKKYCENSPDETILVISNDSDWKNTLEGNKQVIVISDLEAAMVLLWEQLDDKAELFQMLLSKMNKEICSEIKNAALCEAFCIDAIDSTAEVEIKGIKVSSIKEDVIPLDVEADCVLLQITATLDVDGYSEFLDEDHSVWDDEERCYYFCAYTHLDFYHASADVDCEVKISFSDDGSLSNIKLVSTKLLNKWDIDLDLEEAEIEERNMVDYSECEDEYRTERAEAQEEYYRH